MKTLAYLGSIAIIASVVCGGCGNNRPQYTAPTPIKVAQAPTARPKTTATPKPTATPTRAQLRRMRAAARAKARAEARREAIEERRIKREEQERIAEQERYQKSQREEQERIAADKQYENSQQPQSSDTPSDSGRSGGSSASKSKLAYQLATIDNGYVDENDRSVKRFKYLLGELSAHYKENPQQISDMTVRARQLMDGAGVSESLENMMEGMSQVLPERMVNESGQNMQSYAEYMALYMTLRKQGKSHGETIDGMRALTGH